MMQQRVFIIHGWGGKPGEHWVPWLRKELESSGYAVREPAMPDTDNPVIDAWVDKLQLEVGKVDENTYFIGHSVGCQAIMRYLETVVDQVIGGCVFVAGWFKLEGELYEEGEEVIRLSKPWLETPINFAKIREHAKKINVLLSDNDPYNAVGENKKLFEKDLNAKVTILHERGHFTQSDGVTELPEALRAMQGLNS